MFFTKYSDCSLFWRWIVNRASESRCPITVCVCCSLLYVRVNSLSETWCESTGRVTLTHDKHTTEWALLQNTESQIFWRFILYYQTQMVHFRFQMTANGCRNTCVSEATFYECFHTLAGNVQARYREKISLCDGVDPYCIKRANFLRISRICPHVQFPDIIIELSGHSTHSTPRTRWKRWKAWKHTTSLCLAGFMTTGLRASELKIVWSLLGWAYKFLPVWYSCISIRC